MNSLLIRQLYAKCKMHGNGEAQVILSDSELYALIVLAFHDLGWENRCFHCLDIAFPADNYYAIPMKWFESVGFAISPEQILTTLEKGKKYKEDFILYIDNLCALHRRRVKYRKILSAQAIPTMDQIGPRVLLEYGSCDSTLLAHWMTWRKWIYDIDNRSAQETGYVFEPILANCLGGESVGAKNSPVKRIDENGKPTSQGRQIDCYLPSEHIACEFKLRVSIAASGQGRFGEELSFPKECRSAGITPVLLVLDPTPSDRLAELSRTFLAYDGRFYQGKDAWKYMRKLSGKIISVFMEKYIRPPISEIESISFENAGTILLKWSEQEIIVSSQEQQYMITRDVKE